MDDTKTRIWTEKYRPATIEGYVFRDQKLKKQVQGWIKDKFIPHLLISGGPGTGKSTLARILLNELHIEPGDIMTVNMSDQTGVDTVREKIQNFVSLMARGDFKVVLLEEADFATPNAQAALRRVMEDYESSSRFILACNYVHKIIPAIKSRCQNIEIEKLDIEEYTIRLAEILVAENIDFEIETLDSYIQVSYPDLRKTINNLQLNTQDGKLHKITEDGQSTADWQVHAVDLFKKNKITEARKLICSQIRPEEIEDFFRLCYRNLDWWGNTQEKQDIAIVLIRDAMVKHTVCADGEINLAAMLCELSKI